MGLGRHPEPFPLIGAADLRPAPPIQGVRPGRYCVYINYRRSKGKRLDVIHIQYSLSRLSLCERAHRQRWLMRYDLAAKFMGEENGAIEKVRTPFAM